MKNLNKFKGFTLVEVLIVIIIIGILIAALLPKLTGVQAKARDTARKSHASQVASAVMSELANNANSVVTGCVTSASTYTGYLTTIPQDPQGAAGPQSTVTVGTCTTAATAGDYRVAVVGTKKEVVIALEEGDGNCGLDGVIGGSGAFCVVLE